MVLLNISFSIFMKYVTIATILSVAGYLIAMVIFMLLFDKYGDSLSERLERILKLIAFIFIGISVICILILMFGGAGYGIKCIYDTFNK